MSDETRENVEVLAQSMYEVYLRRLGDDRGFQEDLLSRLLSVWLAEHIVPGDKQQTLLARYNLLRSLIDRVWSLVEMRDSGVNCFPGDFAK